MIKRDIKFRVWDIRLSKYIPFDSLLVHNFDSKEYIYQQYSGLKDRKGIDVYEGDIVMCNSNKVYIVLCNGPYFILFNCMEVLPPAIHLTSLSIIGNLFKDTEFYAELTKGH